MQNIHQPPFIAIPGATDIRRIALMPSELRWQDELHEYLIKWRWGHYKDELNTLLYAVAHKQYPHYYDKHPSTEVAAVMEFIKDTDHNAVIMAYNTSTEKLTFSTDFISPRNQRKQIDIRFLTLSTIFPLGIENAFGNLRAFNKGRFKIDDAKWKAAGMPSTDSTFYYCEECRLAQRDHQIIEIPGPPAKGNAVSVKGDPTHFCQCTGCLAVTGPWVPAQF